MKSWSQARRQTFQRHIPSHVEDFFSRDGGPAASSRWIVSQGDRSLYATSAEELFWATVENDQVVGVDFIEGPKAQALYHRHVYDTSPEFNARILASMKVGLSLPEAMKDFYKRPMRPSYGLRSRSEHGQVRVYPFHDNGSPRRTAMVEIEVSSDQIIRSARILSLDELATLSF